ncbi:tetrathionate reductase subunit B precursor [bacterium BMS3Bbin06]|nr:tetrathionate reductase subunit B precursor [bacterium BMS3Bbin06]GBE36221.1 tetrathionate reductase subunit B precursor [bacterium BMS3Bbin07]
MAFNEIVKMHEDLDRALRKPVSKRSWVMVIDVRKCVGDRACVVACMAENVCPPGTSYRWVFETEFRGYPNLDKFYMPGNCQHCDNPPCMKAANKLKNGTIKKRPDGIVVFDYEKLKKSPDAREAAKKACPYYAIVDDNGGYYTDNTPILEPYETRTFYEDNERLTRKKTKGTIRKCTFCLHRLESGMIPACVSTCIGRAMYFGDKSDPKSLVSELIKKEDVWNPKAKLGTKPRVYYIGYKDRANIATSTSATCQVCHQ